MAWLLSGTDDPFVQTFHTIIKEIEKSKINQVLQHEAEGEISKPSTKNYDLRRQVIEALNKSGGERRLRNHIYRLMQKRISVPHPLQTSECFKEPIGYIRKAQMNWEKRVLKSMNSMCTELSVPLARKRTDKEQREILSRWTELGTDEQDVSQYRPVYAPKDFLDVIAGIKNPNIRESSETSSLFYNWGVVQAPLYVKDIHKLRLQFSELSINQCQSGVDDMSEVPQDLFQQERIKLGKKVLEHDHTPVTEEFCKKGIPASLRAASWTQLLDVYVDDVDRLYYHQLKTNVLQHYLLVDSLIHKDIKLTATNDDQYFVFEDYIYQVLLPFTRDTSVLSHFDNSSATPPKAYIQGKLGAEDCAVIYPPNGVIPFHGFSMYVVPLCYLFNDPVVLYFVFREFYCGYLHRLHNISSDSQGILSLCLLFEKLLQTQEPQLFFHLKSMDIQPLRLAFKWLIRAFSGYLASEQVLLLWDRVLAYRSLELLPILAAGIFSFRKSNLMQIQNLATAEAVLADISSLKVIPLIQLLLFSHS